MLPRHPAALLVTLLLFATGCPPSEPKPEDASGEAGMRDTAEADVADGGTDVRDTTDTESPDTDEPTDGGDTLAPDAGDTGGDPTDGSDTSPTDTTENPDTRPVDTADGESFDTDVADAADTTDTTDTDGGSIPATGWTRLIGTSGIDIGAVVALGSGGDVYASGMTNRSLGGQSYSGGFLDGWVAKFDATGSRQWVRLFGSSGSDAVEEIAFANGSLYVVGYVDGTIGGQSYAGGNSDGFLAKYDPQGNRQWIRLVGSAKTDSLADLTILPSGDVVAVGAIGGPVAGQSYDGGKTDALLVGFDPQGNPRWTTLTGASGEEAFVSIARAGSNGLLIGGAADGPLAGQTFSGGKTDSFIAEFDTSGTRQWLQMIGASGDDRAFDVATDGAGGRYVTGIVGNQLGTGPLDYFVAKFDATGTRQWRSRDMLTGRESSAELLVRGSSQITVAGSTDHAFGGATYNGGGKDMFLADYDTSSGNRTQVRLLGSTNDEDLLGIAAGSGLLLGGTTTGSLDGQTYSGGTSDGFVMRRP